MKRGWTRREMLGASVSTLVLGATDAGAEATRCPPSVPTDPGPFYPSEAFATTADLTRVPGRRGRAKGRVLQVFGRVVDAQCRPVPKARVEIWQADPRGRYRHPRSVKRGRLDPGFRYFACLPVDSAGRYLLTTVMPGPYAFAGLKRAPHLHFRIAAPDGREHITEMYFAGDENLRRRDAVWQSRPAATRNALVVPRGTAKTYTDRDGLEPGAVCCAFDLTIQC